MRRAPVVLLAIGALLGAGVSAAPPASASCHTDDADVKALRKKAAAFGKEMTASVRAAVLGLKKDGKALAKQVKKGTMVPDNAYDTWVFCVDDRINTCLEAVDAAHDSTLAAYIAAQAAASSNLKLPRELEAGCGGAADILREKTRDCMELVRDGLGCSGAFKPLQAALHCEEFDVNWQALGPGDPLSLKQIQLQGGSSVPVFPPGKPIVASTTCAGEITILVESPGPGKWVTIWGDGEPFSEGEQEFTAPKGELVLVTFTGLAPGEWWVATSDDPTLENGKIHSEQMVTVPAWEAASSPVCTETSVTATWNSSPVAVGPLSAISVTKNASGNITFVLATFEASGEGGSLWANWTFGSPVAPSTTAYSRQPGDTLFVGGTVYNNSFIVDVATIANIGNLLDAAPGSAAGMHITGTGFHPSGGPSVIDFCLAGADAQVTVTTVP